MGLAPAIDFIREWMVRGHDSYGGSSFVQIAIAFNMATTGVAFFRNWIEGLSQKTVSKRYPQFASALDAPSKDENSLKTTQAIKKALDEIKMDTDRLFKLFTIISWIMVSWGVIGLYLNYSHCSNLIIIAVWPVFIILVLAISKIKCWSVLSKIKHFEEITQLQVATTPASISKQIIIIKKEISTNTPAQPPSPPDNP